MDSKKSILIVDDNKDFCESMKIFLSSNECFNVIGTAHDGDNGYDMILADEPDLVLADVVMPGSDGLTLISRIQQCNTLLKKPKIIVLSSTCCDSVIAKVIRAGAEFYMIKPFDFSVLEERITEMFSFAEKSGGVRNSCVEKDIEADITAYIQQLGVPASIKGYYYVRRAIKLAVENTDAINSITKFLYPSIAKHYGTTPVRVERAIRHAIDIAWDRGNPAMLSDLFGYTLNCNKRRPTNGEFIALIADKIRLELKNGTVMTC